MTIKKNTRKAGKPNYLDAITKPNYHDKTPG